MAREGTRIYGWERLSGFSSGWAGDAFGRQVARWMNGWIGGRC